MRTAYEQFIRSQADCLVEILDSVGRPFMIMSLEQAFRQRLRHYLALCLLYDRTGQLYLLQRSKQSPFFAELWDLPAAVVQAGEAPVDAVINCLYTELRIRPSNCLLLKHIVADSSRYLPDLFIFQALAPSQTPAPDNSNIDKVICVVRKDLQILLRDFPSQLSPFLQYIGAEIIRGVMDGSSEREG